MNSGHNSIQHCIHACIHVEKMNPIHVHVESIYKLRKHVKKSKANNGIVSGLSLQSTNLSDAR